MSKLIYSGESDFSDLKASAKPERTDTESTTAAPRGSRDKELRRKMFGSSDESENMSPGSNRSRSTSYEASVEHEEVRLHESIDDSVRIHRSHSRSDTGYRGDRGASSHVGIAQEEQDRNALRSAPENKPWMAGLSEF